MRFVFDVESNGLYGPGFAVGWVLMDHGNTVSTGFLRCPVDAEISPWVVENVIPYLEPENCKSSLDLRHKFWDAWMAAKALGATAWADCAFPVEVDALPALKTRGFWFQTEKTSEPGLHLLDRVDSALPTLFLCC
mgnify:CR=1 FL=1